MDKVTKEYFASLFVTFATCNAGVLQGLNSYQNLTVFPFQTKSIFFPIKENFSLLWTKNSTMKIYVDRYRELKATCIT
jgi:hypothetical protein